MSNKRELVFLLLGIIALPSAGCYAQRWANDAGETAYNELSPQALLQKYRYFKEMASQLDAKQANILSNQATMNSWEKRYGSDVSKWPRNVSDNYDQRLTEYNDLVMNYNNLAAEYNKAMSDLSYKFCNVGQMPAGLPPDATALSRSFASYKTK